MLFLAASKGNYFQWSSEHDVVMSSPDRGQIWENIAAALDSLQQKDGCQSEVLLRSFVHGT